MIGWVEVMEPADVPDVAGGRPGADEHGRGRAEAVHRPGVRHLPPRRRRGARAVAAGRLRHGGAACRAAAPSTADEAYLRESIVNPQAKLVAGFQPLMPTFQGLVTEEQLNAADRLHQVAGSEAAGGRRGHAGGGARAAPHSRRRRRRRRSGRATREPGNDMQTAAAVATAELPEHRAHRAVVAADARPQAHRPPVPARHHASSSRSAGCSPCGIRLELLTPGGDVFESETYNKVFTMHGVAMVFFFLIPSIPGDAGQLPGADDDRREGPGVPAHQPAQLVHLHARRAVHARPRCCSAASTRAGRSTRPTARRLATRT